MQQIENKTFGNSGMGRNKMRAANRIAIGDKAYKLQDDLRKRNAYRKACGLPEVKS